MFNFVIILLVLSGTVIFVLSIAAFQRRTSSLALSFAVSMLCAAIWNFGFAAEIISPTLSEKIIWANFQFIGIGFLPVAWLAIALIDTGQSRQTLRLIPALCAIPALTLIIIWTNSYHHLFRHNPFISTAGVPFPVLTNDYGLYFYAVHAPYGYFLFAAALFLLVRAWRRAPAIYRRQRFILFISLVLPLVVDVLYVFGIAPIPAFNLTPIMFSFSGILLGINILQFRFLDVLPLAYEATVNQMDVGVIVIDAAGQVSHLNPAAEKITGISIDQAIGMEARQLFSFLVSSATPTKDRTEIVIKQGEVENTYQLQRSPILQDQTLVGQVVTLNNITDLARLHQQVEKLSITDPLTGALNRRALDQSIEQEITRARRYRNKLSLILLDVDNFKEINDHFGHQTGDAILVAIVQTIRNKIRANDLIFRYGGDEFIALLIETDPAVALEIANRIRIELNQINPDGDHTPIRQVQASLGVAVYSPDDTLDSLLRRADQALYQAKAAGKDRAVLL
jgi:diguanylate cyclase (GGDEF)-like protein/PAS domain S-box-containing protein